MCERVNMRMFVCLLVCVYVCVRACVCACVRYVKEIISARFFLQRYIIVQCLLVDTS